MRYKHLPIELKAAIKGGVNETSKQQVPGEHSHDWTLSTCLHRRAGPLVIFPSQEHFFLSSGNFFLQQTGKKSQSCRRRDMPALVLSTRGPTSGSWPRGSLSHWSMDTVEHPTVESPRTTAKGTKVTPQPYARTQCLSKHTWSITFYTPYRDRRTWHYSLTQATPELFRKTWTAQTKSCKSQIPHSW